MNPKTEKWQNILNKIIGLEESEVCFYCWKYDDCTECPMESECRNGLYVEYLQERDKLINVVYRIIERIEKEGEECGTG